MTKIEELRVAYEATPGEWNLSRHATPEYAPQYGIYTEGARDDLAIVRGESNAAFITLAHTMTPALLKAAELLAEVSDARASQDHEFDVDAWYVEVRKALGDWK